MRPTRLATLAAALLLALATTACEETTEPAETIPLGGLFSLTGNWSSLGVTAQAAMQLGVEDVNAWLDAGESGMRFEARILNTQLIPETALGSMQALRSTGVEVVIGPQSSAEVAAIASYANANGMLVVSPSSTAGSLAIAGDNIFRLTPSDTLEAAAIVALMRDEGITRAVPLWRDDAGNDGLQLQTRVQFTAAGGTVATGVEYTPATTDFALTIAALRTQVDLAIAAAGGDTAKVAVVHAGFDEAVSIFTLAAGDPALRRVRWYGTDGTAQSVPLRTSTAAATFAQQVRFWAPLPGLPASASLRWQPLVPRITARAGAAPDAFALAVYDAVWIAAQAYLAAGGRGHLATLRTGFVTAANGYYGATGWTALDAAGDRRFGDFDFFGLTATPTAAWTLRAQYSTQTGTLVRF